MTWQANVLASVIASLAVPASAVSVDVEVEGEFDSCSVTVHTELGDFGGFCSEFPEQYGVPRQTGPFEGTFAFDLSVADADPRDGSGGFGPGVAEGELTVPDSRTLDLSLAEVVSSSDESSGVWEASGDGVDLPDTVCDLSVDLSSTGPFDADRPLPPTELDSQPTGRSIELHCSTLLVQEDGTVVVGFADSSGTVDSIRYGDRDGDGIIDVEDPDTVIEVVNALPVGVFGSASDPEGQRNAMLDRLEEIEAKLLSEDPDDVESAIRSLRNLRKRVDGCDGSPTEMPDPEDWIRECGAQREVRAIIDLLLDNLEA